MEWNLRLWTVSPTLVTTCRTMVARQCRWTRVYSMLERFTLDWNNCGFGLIFHWSWRVMLTVPQCAEFCCMVVGNGVCMAVGVRRYPGDQLFSHSLRRLSCQPKATLRWFLLRQTSALLSSKDDWFFGFRWTLLLCSLGHEGKQAIKPHQETVLFWWCNIFGTI